MDVSIILPCFNEERRIPASLEKLGAFCERAFRDYEVLVVDDGSTDRTWEAVRHFHHFNVRPIRLPRNLGKGAAVKAGMLQARGEHRFFTDADLPYELSAFSSAMDLFQSSGCDLVIGARDLPGSRNGARITTTRRAASRVFSTITELLFGVELGDSQCGFKAFTDRAAEDLFSLCQTSGYAFDVEVLILARSLGLHISKVPVTLVASCGSSVRLPRDGMAMLWELARICIRMKKEYSPQRRRVRRENVLSVGRYRQTKHVPR